MWVERDNALFKLWVLADMLLIPRLQNQIINKAERLSNEENPVPGGHFLKYVWENTASGSPLRRWILHQYATTVMPDVFQKRAYLFPHQMLIELAMFNVDNMKESRKDLQSTHKIFDYEVEVPET